MDVEECVGGGAERVGWGRREGVDVEGVEGGEGGVGDGEVAGVEWGRDGHDPRLDGGDLGLIFDSPWLPHRVFLFIGFKSIYAAC